MTYDVDWDAVEQDLAELWMAANDRDAVTAAMHRIDQQLQRDSTNCGESREPPDRVVFDGLVGVIFRVAAPRRVVVVAVGPSSHRA